MKTRTTTSTNYVTCLVLAKTFTYDKGYKNYGGTIKAGTYLETRKSKKYYYYPWTHRIVRGFGDYVLIPTEYVKVKWFKETRKVTVKMKEVKFKEKMPKKA